MPFVAPIIAVASGVASLAGGIASGMAAQKSAQYNAQVQENNAVTAQRNATIAMEEGEQRAQEEGMQNAQKVGKAKAIFGASGIDPTTGSAEQTEQGIEEAGLTDVQTTQSNAARTAWGYQTQSQNFESQAQLDKMQGASEEEAGFLSGATGALTDWAKFGTASQIFGGGTASNVST